ncbi:hypothetical protein Agub_g7312, partial [Astrephomene gubernaculifera]
DHLGRLQGAVRAAGGLDTVCAAPESFLGSALVIQELSLGSKISRELAIALLSAHADRGPARLLQQPELRLLWRSCFGGEAEVGWGEWWAAFPAGIARLPGLGMGALAERLGGLLAEDTARSAFQRHVLAANNVVPVSSSSARTGASATTAASSSSGISAYALAAAFGAPLTEAAAAGFDDLAGEVAAALAAAALPVEGPCQLPPLPPLHVPREELAERVVAALTGAAAGAGGRGGGGGEKEGAPEKCRAVCLLAPPGLGKSTLAVEVCWRLVRRGGAAGGCVWVELAGARSWHDVEARMCVALGLIKDNSDGSRRLLAALRGCCSPARPLLLVVDSLEEPLMRGGAG